MDRIRIYRIISFAIIFFSVIVIGTNIFPVINNKKDNLISLFYIRKDNMTGELQGEIYPIAIYKNGQYIDARIDVSGEREIQYYKERSYLSNFRYFSIVDEGGKLGEFTVDEILPGEFMCSEILTGRSKSQSNDVLLTIFNGINDSRCSSSCGYKDQKEFNYSLKWTVGVSKYNEYYPANKKTVKIDIARYREDLLSVGNTLLSQYISDGEDKGVEIERMRVFDLDHDGYPEVSAKLKKPLIKTLKVFIDGEEKEEVSNENVNLNVWLNYQGNSPKIILSLISEEQEGSWGSGHDLVGTGDINGDGVDEVIIRSSSWEVVDFEIYEYRQNRLERVFRGAGFGC